MKIISILALCSVAATVCFLALLEADEPARQPAPTTQQADGATAMVANPEYEHWAAFKPGAFAVEKSRTTADGITTELTKTTTLKSLSPEKAVIEIAGVAVTGGKRETLPTVRQDILATVTRAEAEAQRTIQGKTAEGAETLTLCGRAIETQWTEAKILEGDVTTTTKGWVSDEIPGRIVKSDLRQSGATDVRSIHEVVDYGLEPKPHAATRQPEALVADKTDPLVIVRNPEYEHWSQFKPGAFAVEKSRTTADGITTELTKTTTLKSLTPEKAVIELAGVAVTGGKRETLPTVRKDIFATVTRAEAEAQNKIDGKTAEGTETLTLCGRAIETQWTEAKTLDGGVTTTTKGWVSAEIPGRIVKSDVRCSGAMNMRVITELVDYGLSQQPESPVTDVTLGAALVSNPAYEHWAAFKPGAFSAWRIIPPGKESWTTCSYTYTLKTITRELAVVEYAVVQTIEGKEVRDPPVIQEIPAKITEAEAKHQEDSRHETAQGESTLTVAGRPLKTHWTEVEALHLAPNVFYTTWTSDEVPGHTVRTELRSGAAKADALIHELVDYGPKPKPEGARQEPDAATPKPPKAPKPESTPTTQPA